MTPATQNLVRREITTFGELKRELRKCHVVFVWVNCFGTKLSVDDGVYIPVSKTSILERLESHASTAVRCHVTENVLFIG